MTSRADNTALKVGLGQAWSDRTRLLPKATAYAFSLDLNVQSDGPYLTFAPQVDGDGLRHLFGQPVIELPGGVHCEVPTGRIFAVNGEVGKAVDPDSNWFQMRVQVGVGEVAAVASPSAAPDRAPSSKVQKYATSLTFSCTGVLELVGGMAAYRRRSEELNGSVFMTSTQESTTRTYRWLERRQLFGIGRLHGTSRNPRCDPDPRSLNGWMLQFSFDLYGAD